MMSACQVLTLDHQESKANNDQQLTSDLLGCAIARIIEQCCFNSTPDLFNGQTANFTLKPPKMIESTTYIKKANLECYRNNTVLSL
jgi:hypothetical protein